MCRVWPVPPSSMHDADMLQPPQLCSEQEPDIMYGNATINGSSAVIAIDRSLQQGYEKDNLIIPASCSGGSCMTICFVISTAAAN